MPDQIVEITNSGLSLHKSRGFLQVKSERETAGQVAIDDIVAVIVSTPGCMLSTVLIDELCRENIPLVICGRNYLPASIILPVEGQGRQFRIMQAQIAFPQPKRKRAWQTIVQGKIRNQATALAYAGKDNSGLSALAGKVKSGDTENCEAQAARVYWQRLFGGEFKRNRDAGGVNAALNYAYAVLRACLARAVVSAGLHPSFSLHHKNPQNSFNLVDDLMEPFRPIADFLVWQRKALFAQELTPETKSLLSAIVNITVPMEGENSPLSMATVRFCRSVVGCYMGKSASLNIPSLPTLLELGSAEAV